MVRSRLLSSFFKACSHERTWQCMHYAGHRRSLRGFSRSELPMVRERKGLQHTWSARLSEQNPRLTPAVLRPPSPERGAEQRGGPHGERGGAQQTACAALYHAPWPSRARRRPACKPILCNATSVVCWPLSRERPRGMFFLPQGGRMGSSLCVCRSDGPAGTGTVSVCADHVFHEHSRCPSSS